MRDRRSWREATLPGTGRQEPGSGNATKPHIPIQNGTAKYQATRPAVDSLSAGSIRRVTIEVERCCRVLVCTALYRDLRSMRGAPRAYFRASGLVKPQVMSLPMIYWSPPPAELTSPRPEPPTPSGIRRAADLQLDAPDLENLPSLVDATSIVNLIARLPLRRACARSSNSPSPALTGWATVRSICQTVTRLWHAVLYDDGSGFAVSLDDLA